VLSDAEHVPVIAPDQFLKCPDIAGFGGLNQRQFITDWGFTYFGLDGAHFLCDATIFTFRLGPKSVILLAN
jgi:hypothetical protein